MLKIQGERKLILYWLNSTANKIVPFFVINLVRTRLNPRKFNFLFNVAVLWLQTQKESKLQFFFVNVFPVHGLLLQVNEPAHVYLKM